MTAQPTAPHVFSAPWGRHLVLITSLCGVILIGISAVLLARAPENPPWMYQVGTWMPLAIFALCALFSVRGYSLQDHYLIVHRPGWRTRVNLEDLQSVSHQPDATRGSIRIFGNGGLFGFTGLFRNQKLGRYRAFATDISHTVVIRLPIRTIVVTPDNPQKFVEILHPLARDADTN